MSPPRRTSPPRPASLLLALLLAWLPGTAGAAEVWAESILDQASALRDASAKVPSGARILGSQCSDVALPGLSFRYRCIVRFEPRTSDAPQATPPAAKP